MTGRLAIYNPGGKPGLGNNVFGADIANFQLYRALVVQAGFDRVDFLTHATLTAEDMTRALDVPVGATQIGTANILATGVAASAGCVLRGGPKLEELAWLRRQTTGDRGYSLVGLVHTIAPPAMRHDMAMASVAPVQPWDALVCTSPAVQSALGTMFDEWGDYLSSRFGGVVRVRPALPLIPLGVDGARFAGHADRPEARGRVRGALGVAADELLVIWVGRLSFFEKAFPQPMLRAVAEAAAATGVRVHFAMAGWFPNGENGARMYGEAARSYAPDTPFHVVDGNDSTGLADLWAGADIFLSLVDNIQETFGITPLEAMAAGLPVVVSDWDGYRYTVRDGSEGFLIRTLGGPSDALPSEFTLSHATGQRSYQQYVGVVAQHTAVDVAAAANALTRLIQDPALRRRMGRAGRERIRATFDWSVVAPQYRALADALAAIRVDEAGAASGPRRRPVKGDPMRDFAGFATDVLGLDMTLSLRAGCGLADLDRAAAVELDRFAGNWRGTAQEAAAVVILLRDGPATAREILLTFATPRRRAIQLSLLWMAKLGILEWSKQSG